MKEGRLVAARRAITLSQAIATALQTLAVVTEPPATGAAGRLESPISTFTLPTSMPNLRAAVCATTV